MKTKIELIVEVEFEFDIEQICQNVATIIKNDEDWIIYQSSIVYSQNGEMYIGQILRVEIQTYFVCQSKIKLNEDTLIYVNGFGPRFDKKSPKKEFIKRIKEILIEDENLQIINNLN